MKSKVFSRYLMVLLCAGIVPAQSQAQQVPDAIINVDGVGFARMIDGQRVAFDLVAAYDHHRIAEADCSRFQSEVKGVNWCFSSAENQQNFDAATTDSGDNHYLPFVGGHCALGMRYGNLAARGDPRTAIRIGDQLVLNGRLDVRTTFLQDTARNMDNALMRYEIAVSNGDLRTNP